MCYARSACSSANYAMLWVLLYRNERAPGLGFPVQGMFGKGEGGAWHGMASVGLSLALLIAGSVMFQGGTRQVNSPGALLARTAHMVA